MVLESVTVLPVNARNTFDASKGGARVALSRPCLPGALFSEFLVSRHPE